MENSTLAALTVFGGEEQDENYDQLRQCEGVERIQAWGNGWRKVSGESVRRKDHTSSLAAKPCTPSGL